MGLRWGLGECQAALRLSSCIPLGLKGLEASYDLLSALLYTRTS